MARRWKNQCDFCEWLIDQIEQHVEEYVMEHGRAPTFTLQLDWPKRRRRASKPTHIAQSTRAVLADPPPAEQKVTP